MNKQKNAGINVGSSSILVIFILLCLTTFATLSMVSAGADLLLTEKTAASVTEYYSADAQAEELMARIDQVVKAQSKPNLPEGEFVSACAQALQQDVPAASAQQEDDSLLIRYEVPLNESQSLSVTLRMLTGVPAGGRLVREEWQVVSTGEWKPESAGLNLWDGGLSGALPPV